MIGIERSLYMNMSDTSFSNKRMSDIGSHDTFNRAMVGLDVARDASLYGGALSLLLDGKGTSMIGASIGSKLGGGVGAYLDDFVGNNNSYLEAVMSLGGAAGGLFATSKLPQLLGAGVSGVGLGVGTMFAISKLPEIAKQLGSEQVERYRQQSQEALRTRRTPRDSYNSIRKGYTMSAAQGISNNALQSSYLQNMERLQFPMKSSYASYFNPNL